MKLFVTGFMGSGKSHWGKIWARKTGIPFFDLDDRIENALSMPVSKIFEKLGEDRFREIEKTELRKMAETDNFILSCGGGTPCFFENMEWMKNTGTVIYLKATPSYLLERVKDEIEKRPLLQNANSSEMLFFIEKKLQEREPVYNLAHHIWPADRLSEESILAIV